jgi:hypothetical protein
MNDLSVVRLNFGATPTTEQTRVALEHHEIAARWAKTLDWLKIIHGSAVAAIICGFVSFELSIGMFNATITRNPGHFHVRSCRRNRDAT